MVKISRNKPAVIAPPPPPPATATPAATASATLGHSQLLSTFTPSPPTTLPGFPPIPLVPRPPPELEVPGVGKLTQAQTDKLLVSARAAVNQVISYGQMTNTDVPGKTLSDASDAGALKALRELGYQPPATMEAIREQVGALLDWARMPFTFPTPPQTAAPTAGD